MPRARNIKPGFFVNDELSEVDPLGRLLFIGLWTIADREGRLKDRPKKIKAQVLPFDDCDINGLLNELEERGFILRYSVANCGYIQIVNFTKHQNPHIKEQASEIPAPDIHHASTRHAPDNNSESPADSFNLIPDSLNLDADSPVPRKPGGKKRPPAEGRQAIDYYHDLFLDQFKEKPIIQGKKDGELMKRITRTYGIEKTKQLLDIFFSGNDEFTEKAGYTIGVFSSQINKLISSKKGNREPPGWTTLKEWYEEGVEIDEQAGVHEDHGFPDGSS